MGSGRMSSCTIHGIEETAEPLRRQVFISYGRRDAFEFAKLLAADLEERGGYSVFFDLQDIEKGGLFEVRIEQGIRDASHLLAVMTPHSIREESICRDEVVFALNEGKPVVPLRLDPALRPSLLLCRRNWVDFTQDYEEALAVLLGYLSGDGSVLNQPQLPSVTGVVPLDFGPELARFSFGFVGRQWLGCRIDRWLAGEEGRVLLIIGEPGIGKSAIAAWLSQARHGQVVGIYFCTHRNVRTLKPFEFVACLVGQLWTQLDGYERAVAARRPEIPRITASDAFRELIVEPALSMRPPDRCALIIIDALDEATRKGEDETIMEILSSHAEDLPPWLRIVATSRPDIRVRRRMSHLEIIEVQAAGDDNRKDVADYVSGRLRTPTTAMRDGSVREGVTSQLESLAAGNFLYARMVLDALRDGTLAPADLGRLSPGLASFYAAAFGRLFRDQGRYEQEQRPILRALLAALGPLPFRTIRQVVGEQAEVVHRQLGTVTAFLRVLGHAEDAEYALFHKSLGEWLTSRDVAGNYWCDVASGEARLAEICWQEYLSGSPMSSYAAAHLPAHLSKAGRWGDLCRAVEDPAMGLITRWTEQGGCEEGMRLLAGMISYLRQRAGTADSIAGLATQLARLHSQRADYDESRRWLREAVEQATWWRGRKARAVALHELGSLSLYEGNVAAARRAYRRAIRVCTFGMPQFPGEVAANLVGLATLARRQHHHARAAKLASRALHRARQAEDAYHQISAHCLLAMVCKDMLAYEDSESHLAEAELIIEITGARREKPTIELVRGWMMLERGLLSGEMPSAAEHVFNRAVEEADSMTLSASATEARLGLAWCALYRGDTDAARNWQREAGSTASATRNGSLTPLVTLVQAAIALQTGDLGVADQLYLQADEMCRQAGLRGHEGVACVGLGACLWHSHRPIEAEATWRRARLRVRPCSQARRRLIEMGIERSRADRKFAPL